MIEYFCKKNLEDSNSKNSTNFQKLIDLLRELDPNWTSVHWYYLIHHVGNEICPKISENVEFTVMQLYTIFSLVTSTPKLVGLLTPQEVGNALGKTGLEIGPENCVNTSLEILLWLFDCSS